MAHLGIGATIGLMSVVSLPNYFMFRITLDDPHPFPWIRVKLSLAFGKMLFPHSQWQRFESLWETLYPLDKLDDKSFAIINELSECMPAFTQLILQHKPASLRGLQLMDAFPYKARQPSQLQYLYNTWRFSPESMGTAAPSLLFAVIGQAHADANISAITESRLLTKWLTQWAFLKSEKRTKKESKHIIHEIQNLINV